MITLILVVCLAQQPDICHEETPPVDLASSLSCMVQGQQIAAEWVGDHPKWTVSAWKCRIGPREKGL